MAKKKVNPVKQSSQDVIVAMSESLADAVKANPSEFVEATYKGHPAPHIVLSNGLSKYNLHSYGYYKYGDKIMVLKSEQEARPRLFSIEKPKRKRRNTRKKKVSE